MVVKLWLNDWDEFNKYHLYTLFFFTVYTIRGVNMNCVFVLV